MIFHNFFCLRDSRVFYRQKSVGPIGPTLQGRGLNVIAITIRTETINVMHAPWRASPPCGCPRPLCSHSACPRRARRLIHSRACTPKQCTPKQGAPFRTPPCHTCLPHGRAAVHVHAVHAYAAAYQHCERKT
jgi:hypothetical protein